MMISLREFLRTWFLKSYLWTAELLYHKFAWAYECIASFVSFGYWSRWRLDSLQYLIPGAILETGFGTGSLLIEMNERGFDVTGLEPSTQMHRVLGRKIHRREISVKRVMGRTETLPFPAREFRNILSTFPSNYIFNDETSHEVHRVLAETGRWVILGLGMNFKSGIKQTVTKWLWGDWDEVLIQRMAERIIQKGFSSTIIRHETGQYVLPILILERQDE